MLLSADFLTIIFVKTIAIEPGLLELLQKVAGVRFFLDTVYTFICCEPLVAQSVVWNCSFGEGDEQLSAVQVNHVVSSLLLDFSSMIHVNRSFLLASFYFNSIFVIAIF